MRLFSRVLPLIPILLLAGCSSTPPASPPASPTASTSGHRVTVAMMPKLKGIPYFNACEQGAKEAAAALGNVDLIYDGPTEGKVDKQIEMLDTWITRHVDVIAVSPNDPVAISPTLERARAAGIHVITYDADADPTRSGRELFVDQADPPSIARALVDEMARQVGPAAPVAIVTSSLTAANQNEWIKGMKAVMATSYPHMKLVDLKPSEEDHQLAFQVTQDLIKTHPDLKGIWGLSSVAFPGAAEAVQQAGMSGKIAVVGLSTPKDMRPFIKAGTVKTAILWNPIDLGYLTVYTADELAQGTLKPGSTSIRAGRLGALPIRNHEVLLGKPMLFTKANVDRYNF